jgi:hypothetical protein
MKITVNTRYDDAVIIQEIVNDQIAPDIMYQVTKKIIQLQDEEIKKALIKLGWTPPLPEGWVIAREFDGRVRIRPPIGADIAVNVEEWKVLYSLIDAILIARGGD